MSEKKFDDSKQFINVATIGHVDHGKTTLATALLKVAWDRYSAQRPETMVKQPAGGTETFDKNPEEAARKITIVATSNLFETENRYVSVNDCPGHEDFVKNTSAGIEGADIGIFIIDLTQGKEAQSVEHLGLAERARFKSMITVFTKADQVEDDELAALAEEEVLDMVRDARCSEDPNKKLFEEQDIHSVRVSALKALEGDAEAVEGIVKLLELIDTARIKERKPDAPLLLPVSDMANIQGRGVIVSGVIAQGSVKLGDEVEIFTKKKGVVKCVITDMQSFHHKMEKASHGHNVALLPRGLKKDDVGRGDVVSAPGLIKPATKIRVLSYLLSRQKDGGGRKKKIEPGFSPHLFMRCQHVTGKITAFFSSEDPKKQLTHMLPGERGIIEFELTHPSFVEPGLGVTVREGQDGNIALGRVVEVL